VAVDVALCVAELESDEVREGEPDEEVELDADSALDGDAVGVGSGERLVMVAWAEVVAEVVAEALCVRLRTGVALELVLRDASGEAEAVAFVERDGSEVALPVGFAGLDASEDSVADEDVVAIGLALLDARPVLVTEEVAEGVFVTEEIAERVLEPEGLAVLDAERDTAADADAVGVGEVHTRSEMA